MKIPLRDYWQLLHTYLTPQWMRVLLMLLLMLLNVGLNLLNPQIMRNFINTIAVHGAFSVLFNAALLYIVIALGRQVVSLLASYFNERVRWTTTNQLRMDIASHTLALDMTFHNTHTPGEMIERIDGDVDTLSNFFSQFAFSLFSSAITLVCVLVLLYRESLLVGGVFTIFVVVMLLILRRMRERVTPAWKQERQSSADLFGFIEERLAGISDIRANGAQPYVMRRLFHYLRELFEKRRSAILISTRMWWFMFSPLFAGAEMMLLILGAYLYLTHQISLGTIFLLYAYMDALNGPLQQITNQIQDLQRASASIERIRTLLGIERSITDGPGVIFSDGPLSLTFEHVSFAYHNDELVVKDLSLQLAAGKTLGLLGRTGSGKTTITRLIFRLYDPQHGVIRLGGNDLRLAQLDDLRRHVSIVTQDVQLFQATLRDNLTFFDRTIPDERLIEVLHELGLTQWFQSLPAGLDTDIATGGRGLSAGEAQLVAFARVFLRDPGLIILDEASSRLDPATEHMVQQALDRLLQGRTGIIIAHRLATVQRVDDVLILDAGTVREYGSRSALVQNARSYFAHLLQTGLEEILV